jgi:hypothetical protein
MRFENGESRFLRQANLGRLTNANTVVEKTTDKSRSNVVASQLDVVRCEMLPSCLYYNFAQGRKGASGAAVAMLQGGPDAHIATRQASSSPCPKRSNLPYRAWVILHKRERSQNRTLLLGKDNQVSGCRGW